MKYSSFGDLDTEDATQILIVQICQDNIANVNNSDGQDSMVLYMAAVV
jgi:hypothetical protein